jgi:hypothetical protein
MAVSASATAGAFSINLQPAKRDPRAVAEYLNLRLNLPKALSLSKWNMNPPDLAV